MSNFVISKTDFHCHDFGGECFPAIPSAKFRSFNESILGLGDISEPTQTKEVISVVFDLEGFTNYCSEAGTPQQIATFLNEFLIWIFSAFRLKNCFKSDSNYVSLNSSFPFFSKFMGDGVMFLFDTSSFNDSKGIHNIPVQMKEICELYLSDFFRNAVTKYPHIPAKLRCGIAQGSVQSLGNDYVGICINCSARLQKLDSFSFCFSLNGFDITKVGKNPQKYLAILAPIRGIGEKELIGVLKSDYEKLSDDLKLKYIVQ